MRKYSTFASSLIRVIILSIFLSLTAEIALAEDELGSVHQFSYGDSCAQLFEYTDNEIEEILETMNSDAFSELCLPEWPDSCEDYSFLVSPWGSLATGKESDAFCEFTPLQTEGESAQVIR